MSRDGGPLTTWHIVGKHVTPRTSADGIVRLPACGMLAWVDSMSRPVASDGITIRSTHPHVFFTPAVAGKSFDFRGVRFIVGEEACGGVTP